MQTKNNPQINQTEIIKVKPQFVAQRCPICNGFGTLKYGTIPCHACQKKGYILIPTEKEGKR